MSTSSDGSYKGSTQGGGDPILTHAMLVVALVLPLCMATPLQLDSQQHDALNPPPLLSVAHINANRTNVVVPKADGTKHDTTTQSPPLRQPRKRRGLDDDPNMVFQGLTPKKTAPKLYFERVYGLEKGTYIVLDQACIMCGIIDESTGETRYDWCAILNNTLPRTVKDPYGPWPKEALIHNVPDNDYIWSRMIDSKLKVHTTSRLFIPMFRVKYSLRNVFHALTDLESYLSSLDHYKPTGVAFRQGKIFDSTFFQHVLNTATGSTPMYNLTEPVCATEMVIQTTLTEEELRDARKDARTKTPNTEWHERITNQPTIVVLHRRNSRFVNNRNELVAALKRVSPIVFQISLEDLETAAQYTLMQSATTLIGSHGAGLSWGKIMRQNGAVIELSPFPCLHYQAVDYRRIRLPGFHSYMGTCNCTYTLIPSLNNDLSSYCDVPEADPRRFNVTTNVSAVVEAVLRTDPMIRAGWRRNDGIN
eukprot:m.146070 g.146070  ORF g.146070 m.146070 type:complete len:477 (-) comp11641_c0_seq1:72-1502(-)